MKWLAIAASVALVCACATSRASSAASRPTPYPQASAPASSTPKNKIPAKRRRRHYREPTQKAPTPDRISEIQSALARNGFYEGDPNGKWDANTVSAMRNFQSANGLESTGKIDALTLQKLGLGSDIAGVSAPKPVPLPGSITPAPTSSAPPVSQQPAKAPASSSAGAPSASNALLPAADPKPHQL
jgi:peptidoglycan hydrolase-like protein with peptidoglycan-binding domain